MGGGLKSWVNTTDKFITEVIYKIKKKWLKADRKQMQQLLKKKEEIDNETDIVRKKYLDLLNKSEAISKKIDILNEKYTYKRNIKVENKYYNYYERGGI